MSNTLLLFWVSLEYLLLVWVFAPCGMCSICIFVVYVNMYTTCFGLVPWPVKEVTTFCSCVMDPFPQGCCQVLVVSYTQCFCESFMPQLPFRRSGFGCTETIISCLLINLRTISILLFDGCSYSIAYVWHINGLEKHLASVEVLEFCFPLTYLKEQEHEFPVILSC